MDPSRPMKLVVLLDLRVSPTLIMTLPFGFIPSNVVVWSCVCRVMLNKVRGYLVIYRVLTRIHARSAHVSNYLSIEGRPSRTAPCVTANL